MRRKIFIGSEHLSSVVLSILISHIEVGAFSTVGRASNHSAADLEMGKERQPCVLLTTSSAIKLEKM